MTDIGADPRTRNVSGIASRFGASLNEIVAILLVIVTGGGFLYPIGGIDPGLPKSALETSARLQITYAICYGLIISPAFFSLRKYWNVIHSNLVLFSFPLIAVASLSWSPDPDITFRKSIAFLLQFLSAAAIAVRFPDKRGMTFVMRVLVGVVVLSCATVLVSPRYGIHNATDYFASVHAGQWRGIFSHRTMLGQLSALLLVMLVASGPFIVRNRTLKWGIVALCALCVAMAQSGGSILTLIICGGSCLVVVNSGRLSPETRTIVFAVLGLAALALVSYSDELGGVALDLLGKQPDLTGRVPFWNALATAAARHPIFGNGYPSVLVFRSLGSEEFLYAPNAQNGYLDTFLTMGAAGIFSLLIMFGTMLVRSYSRAIAGRQSERRIATMAFVVAVFFIEADAIEAFVTDIQNVFVFVFAVAFLSVSPAISEPV
jgi:exopolysaccharide production protein ExoQ